MSAIIGLVATFMIGGCAAEPVGHEDAESEEAADSLSLGKRWKGTLLWQGNWSFLTACDSYSKAKKRVVFFCDEKPTRDFVDNGFWVAAPRNLASPFRSLCHEVVSVCKGDACVSAKLVERSVDSTRWEASGAVIEALGGDTGFRSCTSTWGSVKGVTIERE